MTLPHQLGDASPGPVSTFGKHVPFTERLAHFFRQNPGAWIASDQLAVVAGRCAWRTRVSELRRQPYLLNIENHLRRVKRQDGTSFIVSEYRLVQTAAAGSTEPDIQQGLSV